MFVISNISFVIINYSIRAWPEYHVSLLRISFQKALCVMYGQNVVINFILFVWVTPNQKMKLGLHKILSIGNIYAVLQNGWISYYILYYWIELNWMIKSWCVHIIYVGTKKRDWSLTSQVLYHEPNSSSFYLKEYNIKHGLFSNIQPFFHMYS